MSYSQRGRNLYGSAGEVIIWNMDRNTGVARAYANWRVIITRAGSRRFLRGFGRLIDWSPVKSIPGNARVAVDNECGFIKTSSTDEGHACCERPPGDSLQRSISLCHAHSPMRPWKDNGIDFRVNISHPISLYVQPGLHGSF